MIILLFFLLIFIVVFIIFKYDDKKVSDTIKFWNYIDELNRKK